MHQGCYNVGVLGRMGETGFRRVISSEVTYMRFVCKPINGRKLFWLFGCGSLRGINHLGSQGYHPQILLFASGLIVPLSFVGFALRAQELLRCLQAKASQTPLIVFVARAFEPVALHAYYVSFSCAAAAAAINAVFGFLLAWVLVKCVGWQIDSGYQ